MTTGVSIGAEEIEAFQQVGAVCLRQVFSDHWVSVVREGIARNMAQSDSPDLWVDGDAGGFFQGSAQWKEVPEYEDFMRNSPARLIAARLLQARKINFLHDHTLVKNAGANTKTLWHQDQPYSPIDGTQFMAIWMPVDPVPRDTVLEFVAGSHKAGKWYRPRRFATGELREGDDPKWEILPDIDARPDDFEIVGWAVEPGDCLCFHGLTLHGAPGNSRGTPRRILTTRWTGDDARFVRRKGEMSPPPPKVNPPEDGGVLDCDDFPVVWRA